MDNQNPTQAPIQTPPVETAPSQPAQTPPPPKKSFPKALIVLIICLVIIFFLFPFIYFTFNLVNNGFFKSRGPETSKLTPTLAPTSTPDPTADWKTYEDSENGFSLKYPSDWKIVEEESNLTFSETATAEGEKPALVAVHIFETAKLGPNPYGNYTPFDYKEFTRGDKTFVLMATTFQIGGSASKETEKLAIETLAKMASTFKFTDQAVDTSTWKTYTNNLYGYSFKYPSNGNVSEEKYTGGVNDLEKEAMTLTYNGGTLVITGNKGGHGYPSIRTKVINIAGVQTDKFYGSETEGVIKAIQSPKMDQISFSFTLPTANAEDVDGTFDQILSTYKFTQ